MVDPFSIVLAFLPLVGYLLLLAVVRISRRVLVTTGGRDLAAVLVAIVGLVMIGPMELFFPTPTAMILGPWVWIPLLLLYGLIGGLLVLTSRPKLVIYGRMPEDLFPAILRAAQAMDSGATGDAATWQIHLPSHGAHLRLDAAPGHDCVNLLSFEPLLPVAFWELLLARVRLEVRAVPPPVRRRGFGSLGAAILMLVWVVRYALREPNLLVDSFRDWLIR